MPPTSLLGANDKAKVELHPSPPPPQVYWLFFIALVKHFRLPVSEGESMMAGSHGRRKPEQGAKRASFTLSAQTLSRANSKVGMDMNSHSPPPVAYFLQQGCTP